MRSPPARTGARGPALRAGRRRPRGPWCTPALLRAAARYLPEARWARDLLVCGALLAAALLCLRLGTLGDRLGKMGTRKPISGAGGARARPAKVRLQDEPPKGAPRRHPKQGVAEKIAVCSRIIGGADSQEFGLNDHMTCATLARGDRPLVFWHVPKGGGSSMCYLALEVGEAVRTDKDHPSGSYQSGDCSEELGDWEREHGRPGWCHESCHPRERLALAEGTQQTQAQLLEQYVVGDGLTFLAPEHGISRHGWRPERLSEFGYTGGRPYSFTMLREPRARVRSHYHAKIAEVLWDGKPNAFGRELGLDHEPPTFAEFLRLWQPDNYYVRFVLGLWDKEVEIGAGHLEEAKAVLRGLDFVLIIERLGESGCLFGKIGWDADAVPLSNRWDKAEIAAEDDPQVDALLDALSEFDAPLYEYGVGLFNETLALCKCCDSRVVKENLPEEAQAGAPP